MSIMSDTAAGEINDGAVPTATGVLITRKTLDEWECGPITIDVCNSSSNDIAKSINFTETIGHKKRTQVWEERWWQLLPTKRWVESQWWQY